MKLNEIYKLFITMGIENDPRGENAVGETLKKAKEEYADLKDAAKEEFDLERLANPYADTRILYGDPQIEVTGVIAGIDMESQEVLLADRLRERGDGIDAVISHHPEGRALANLDKVMPMQADIWRKYGVPVNIGDALITGRMREVQRSFLPVNHTRPVDAARLLDIPFMCAHTVADNVVNTYLQAILDDKAPETVKGVMEIVKEVPEYKAAAQTSIGPVLLIGTPETRAGKIMVDMTGGTGGPKDSISQLAEAGVGTIVGMHMNDKNREEAEKRHLNVVIAGHISSDSIGMNLLLDAIERQGVGVTPCSGLIRVTRS